MTSSKDVRLSWPRKCFFFESRIFTTLPDFLTYLLLFRRMSGWVDLKKIFLSCSSNAFPDFLSYLLLFPRMTGWVDLTHFFSSLPYLQLYRISLLAYHFFERCQAELTSKNVVRISLIHHLTGNPYLLTTFIEGCQAKLTSKIVFVSRLVDF